jgi:hypothetical protein
MVRRSRPRVLEPITATSTAPALSVARATAFRSHRIPTLSATRIDGADLKAELEKDA